MVDGIEIERLQRQPGSQVPHWIRASSRIRSRRAGPATRRACGGAVARVREPRRETGRCARPTGSGRGAGPPTPRASPSIPPRTGGPCGRERTRCNRHPRDPRPMPGRSTAARPSAPAARGARRACRSRSDGPARADRSTRSSRGGALRPRALPGAPVLRGAATDVLARDQPIRGRGGTSIARQAGPDERLVGDVVAEKRPEIRW